MTTPQLDLTEAQKAQITRLREAGAMVAEIAHKTGAQYWQVREYLCTTPGLSFLVR